MKSKKLQSLNVDIIHSNNELDKSIKLYNDFVLSKLQEDFSGFSFNLKPDPEDCFLFFVEVSGLTENDDEELIYDKIDNYLQAECSGVICYIVVIQE